MAVFHSKITNPWAEAGAGLGKGLSAGLRALAEGKLKKMQDKEEEEELQKAGLTPEEALLVRKFKANPAAQQKMLSGFLSQSRGQGETGEPSPEESMAQPNSFKSTLQQSARGPANAPGGLEEQLANAIKSGSAKNLGLQDVLRLMSGQGTGQMPEQQPEQELEQMPQQTAAAQKPMAKKGFEYKAPAGNRPTTGLSTKDIQAQERLQETRQRRIDTVNDKKFAPYHAQKQHIDLLESGVLDAIRLLDTNKTPEGAAGAWQAKSRRFQNQETQDLSKIYADIRNNATAAERGPVTGAKLSAQGQAKPELDLDKAVQRHILEGYLKYKVRPFKDFIEIAQNLIAENNYQQPENLWERARIIYDQTKEAREKEYAQEAEQQSLKDNYDLEQKGTSYGAIPDASKYAGSDDYVLNLNGITYYPYVDGWKPRKPKGK